MAVCFFEFSIAFPFFSCTSGPPPFPDTKTFQINIFTIEDLQRKITIQFLDLRSCLGTVNVGSSKKIPDMLEIH